jgi:hypothetical protein
MKCLGWWVVLRWIMGCVVGGSFCYGGRNWHCRPGSNVSIVGLGRGFAPGRIKVSGIIIMESHDYTQAMA